MTAPDASRANPWPLVIGLVTGAAFAVMLALSWTTFGTNDMTTWLRFRDGLAASGGLRLYETERGAIDGFFHPPFMIHVIAAWDALARATGAPFPFWMRLPSVLAASASVGVVYALLRPDRHPRWGLPVALFAAAPAAVMIAGFHGNTDPVLVCFLLVAVWCLERWRTAVGAGIACGLALSIKLSPMIFLPLFFFYLRTWRARAAYVLALGATWVALAMPFLAQNPLLVLRQILGYGSLFGYWGLGWLMARVPPKLARLEALYADYGKYALLALLVYLAWRMNRRDDRPPLLLQGAVIALTFLALTPGFGVQYLAWGLPWVVMLGAGASALFYAASGGYLFAVYHFYAGALPWRLADMTRLGVWDQPRHLEVLGLGCWAVVVYLAWRAFRASRARQ